MLVVGRSWQKRKGKKKEFHLRDVRDVRPIHFFTLQCLQAGRPLLLAASQTTYECMVNRTTWCLWPTMAGDIRGFSLSSFSIYPSKKPYVHGCCLIDVRDSSEVEQIGRRRMNWNSSVFTICMYLPKLLCLLSASLYAFTFSNWPQLFCSFAYFPARRKWNKSALTVWVGCWKRHLSTQPENT